ncbi:hypothetical protein [Paludisphaera soli]|uniref:hypothetical protein n=1 Tax=Paludisphaera soli TaxID=2712865 RepID=UPI0013EBFE30|nr:hypothetical protein [Paludisphaera soli]
MIRRDTVRVAHWILTLVLAGLAGWMFVETFVAKAHIVMAEDQTDVFDQMRRQVEEGEGADPSLLGYVLWYYPSGTKQVEGSHLDRIVERDRQGAVREILAIFRARTGEDFGDDPRRWIVELEKRKAPGPGPKGD